MNIDKSKILNDLMEYKGIVKKSDFAKFLEISTQNLSAWHKRNTFDEDKLFEKFPEVTKMFILTGEGEMLNLERKIRNEVSPVPDGEYMMVEYVDLRASAGRLGAGLVDLLPETHRRLVPKEFDNGQFLVIRVDGDSMNDGTSRSLSDGDEILIAEKSAEQWDELPIRKTVFVITSREGNVIKQIVEINKEEGYVLCRSFNPTYEDFEIKIEDIFQIFVVCKIVQKQISLT